jgi:hypothetical protein
MVLRSLLCRASLYDSADLADSVRRDATPAPNRQPRHTSVLFSMHILCVVECHSLRIFMKTAYKSFQSLCPILRWLKPFSSSSYQTSFSSSPSLSPPPYYSCMHNVLAPAFSRWREMALESRRLRAIARRVVLRCMRAALVPAFARWHESTWESKHKRQLAMRAAVRWAKGLLWGALQQWKDWIRRREHCAGALGERLAACRAWWGEWPIPPLHLYGPLLMQAPPQPRPS